MEADEDREPVYRPKEAAVLLRVNPKTLVKWIREGRVLPGETFRTGGGHHRIRRRYIDRIRNNGVPPQDGAA